MEHNEQGIALLDAMIAALIITIVGLFSLTIFYRASIEVQSESKAVLAQEIISSMQSQLEVSNNPMSWNGQTIQSTSSTYSTSNAAGTIQNIQTLLSRVPQSSLAITVSSLSNNNTCPCTDSLTVSLNGETFAQNSEIQY